MEPLPQFLFQLGNAVIRIHKNKNNTFVIIKIVILLQHNRPDVKFIKILTFNIQKMIQTKTDNLNKKNTKLNNF